MQNGNYTGNVGGNCQSLCRLPAGYNTNNYFDGPALPQGSCAGNAVCVPGGNEQGMNDLGVCLLSCTAASQCRPGYICAQTFGTHTFTNGYCTPMDCLMGGTCPTGTTCHPMQTAQGQQFGRCG